MRNLSEMRCDRGFTLLEVILSSTILTVMVFLMTTLSISGSDAQKYAERLNRTTEIAQRLLDDARQELISSVILFHDNTIGNAYKDLLDHSSTKTPITGKLPKLETTEIFEKDPTSSLAKTGNELLFTRYAWSTVFETLAGNRYQIDVYRFVYYYLAEEEDGPQPGSPIGLNLVKWIGEAMVDGDQIDAIEDSTDRTEVLSHLVNQTADVNGKIHPSAEIVWLRGEDPSLPTTLRHIQPSGILMDDPQVPRSSIWKLYADAGHTEDGMLFFRHHSIATNYARTTLGVGRFGIQDMSGDGFPHGFELQMIGPASARQILLHMVLVGNNRQGQIPHARVQAIIDARDL